MIKNHLNIIAIIMSFNYVMCDYLHENKKPNIIIIMADDLGRNDVSYNNMNQFLTPNIDALAFNGLILNKYYVPPMCTPSRTALMTGKYPIRSGMQHFVIANDQPWGLCTSEKLLPEYFQDAGYSTNLIGKWHLGFFKKHFTPTFRGFDYHYGYMGGYIDYYDQSLHALPYTKGHDFYRNLEQSYETIGNYTTDLLTEEAVRVIKNHDTMKKPLFLMLNHLAPHAGNEDNPMQAPKSEVKKFEHIRKRKRRIFAAMVSKLDESVGKVMAALKQKDMLCNSIVIFYSDNGAPTIGLHANAGSNFPFKGQKNSPWEGAVRVPGIIYSPLLGRQMDVSNQVFHVTDWLPTLAAAAGIKLDRNIQLDGRNLWKYLNTGHVIERKILHNLDDVDGYSSYLRGHWKYVNGTTLKGLTDLWLGEIGNELDPRSYDYESTILNSVTNQALNRPGKCSKYSLNRRRIFSLRARTEVRCTRYNLFEENYDMECNPTESPCLFNLLIDPCERYNFASSEANLMDLIEDEIEDLRDEAVAPLNKKGDLRANPALHSNTWTWWVDDSNGDIGIPGTSCQVSYSPINK